MSTPLRKRPKQDKTGCNDNDKTPDKDPVKDAQDDDNDAFEQERLAMQNQVEAFQRTLKTWTPDQKMKFMSRLTPSVKDEFRLHVSTLFATDYFTLLPTEIRMKIFRSLDLTSLLVAERVCKTWRKETLDLWHLMFEASEYAPLKIKPIESRDWKHAYMTSFHKYDQALDNWITGRCKTYTITANSNGIYCVQYDEDKIVSGSRDNTIRIWDMKTRVLKSSLTGHQGSVLCLQFDSNKIISGSSDKTIKWWDLSTGKFLNTFRKHTSSVLHLMFDDTLLVSCSKDNSILLWAFDPTQPATIVHTHTLTGHTAPVHVVQFDKRYIVSASGDKTIRIWNRTTLALEKTLKGHKRGIACLHYRKNLIASGSLDNSIKLWDVKTGNLIRSIDDAHTGMVRCIRMDDRHIVSGSYDCSIKLWDLKTGWGIRTFHGHEHRVFKIQFDRLTMVSCSHDDKLIVWDFSPQPLETADDAIEEERAVMIENDNNPIRES